jgi:hypothetical protein
MPESMRGMRLGSLSMEREEGVELAARRSITFVCENDHEFKLAFALEAEIPNTWDCKVCHTKSSRLRDGELVRDISLQVEAPRSHFDMVLERRTRAELEALLEEVLADVKKRRAEGRLTS